MKKYIAEFIGTFGLTFVVILSVARLFPIATPILAGMVLALFVYALGHVSGTHINPAVTLGALAIKKIKVKDAVIYIVAQVIGAFAAFYVAHSLFAIPALNLVVANSYLVFFAELIGTAFFTFGIASVVYGNTPDAVGGMVIGASLTLGIVIAVALGSNGILNPAVAIGLGSINLVYALGPIVGSALGMYGYKMIAEK
jgi:aquaporin Z